MGNIINMLKKMLKSDDIIQTSFKVLALDPEILSGYNGSLGWFLTCLVDEGKLPEGVIYVGSGKDEGLIEAIYYKDATDQEKIKEFLEEFNISVE